MIRVFSSAGEVRAAIGEEIGPTDWFAVDQARIGAFAEVKEVLLRGGGFSRVHGA